MASESEVLPYLLNNTYLSAINAPNAAGQACDFQAKGLPVVRLVLNAAGRVQLHWGAALLPAAGAVFTWDFGDPALAGGKALLGAGHNGQARRL